MEYLELTIKTVPEQIDRLVNALTAAGFADLVIEDENQFETFLEENRAYWDYIDEELQEKLQGLCCVKLYLEKEDSPSLDRLKGLLSSLESSMGTLELTVQELPQTDWSESWKDQYPPQYVGENLVVLPYWLQEETDRLAVILDPGLTFGTGAHQTTQMVMEQMEKLPLKDSNCLDLGSGSGILSITALRLGAKTATGVDVDPKAEDIARENALYNGFDSPAFTALTGNVTEDKDLMERLQQNRYDLVLVNIVADVIISLAPVLPQFLDEKSVLILSGILDTRLQDVKNALAKAGLQLTGQFEKDEWRCLTAKRSNL